MISVLQVVRDECLKKWKYVEGDIDVGEKLGSGYPSGECVRVRGTTLFNL